VVGESAVIKGDVICDNIDLWGKLTGTIYVKDTLSLKSGCTVNGSINVRRFMVELGSEFNGTCKMINEEEYDKKVKEIEAEFGPAASKGTEFDAKGAASKASESRQTAAKQ
ncbi:MAG: polymer-forming cytoskeletal protein, partial [Bacteroidales bacterium]|nr:polymer-forming cytoskeletal protein [Bacteroidales bacterium]